MCNFTGGGFFEEIGVVQLVGYPDLTPIIQANRIVVVLHVI